MERLAPQRPSGIGRNTLRTWGILFLICEVVSAAVLQNRILGLGTVTGPQLLEAMQSPDVMAIATAALVMKVLGACAVPIFAFLLAEGAKHTSDFGAYLLRVVELAVISETPYNLAYSGKLVDFSSRNPVFGLALALVMLYFFRRYTGRSFKTAAIRLAVTAAAVLWSIMLGVEQGGILVVLVAVLWVLWDKPTLRNISAATVAMVCSAFSLFLMASPMAFLAIHAYNGEQGNDKRLLNYAVYPVLLILAALAGTFLV